MYYEMRTDSLNEKYIQFRIKNSSKEEKTKSLSNAGVLLIARVSVCARVFVCVRLSFF